MEKSGLFLTEQLFSYSFGKKWPWKKVTPEKSGLGKKWSNYT
jgi:hypothetical protein